MKVESLEFWETVKKEYNPKLEKYICSTSKTFEKIWNSNDDKIIINLANEYVNEIKAKFECGLYVYLFIGVGTTERIDFINWCINKFKTKKNE